jgi:ribosomal protein L11 methyltransferase
MNCDKAANKPPTAETMGAAIMAIVDRSPTPLLARDLERQVMAKLGLERHVARRLIRELVGQNLLAYRVNLGHTFIGPAYDRPHCIGGRIVIVPQGQRWRSQPGDAVVTLQRGAAFGYGSHATTLLCLEGLDRLMPAFDAIVSTIHSRLCDVGTGSGILALAGLKLGIAKALAIDTDSCARHEARTNAQLNDLAGRVTIRSEALSANDGQFDLIMANLRWPTLSSLGQVFSRHLKENGALVVSGLRSDEAGQLIGEYQLLGLTCVWQGEHGGWRGMVFRLVNSLADDLRNSTDR